MAQLELDDRGLVVSCVACGQKNRLPYDRLSAPARCGTCKTELSGTSTPLEVESTDDFDRLITRANIPVVVDYWAPWCGPCRAIAPVLDSLVEADGRVKLAKVNVDEEPALAARHEIRSIPTILLVKDGRVVDRVVGAVPRSTLAAKIDRALGTLP
jgi:thioredoxin 2